MDAAFLFIVSGFMIGFLGSVHCLGMCGPIALSLPVYNLNKLNRSLAILLYNIGRALTYALLGLLFGSIGAGFHLFGLQQWLSIIAGILILLFLFSVRFSFPGSGALQPLTDKVKNTLSTYLKEDKTPSSYFMIGLLNGLLPCGLVYVGIAAALATGSISGGALLMFAFGCGTFPMMASIMAFGRFVSVNKRQVINKIAPYIIGLMGVLLIIRGMNLGIPFLSPKNVSTSEKFEVDCCKDK